MVKPEVRGPCVIWEPAKGPYQAWPARGIVLGSVDHLCPCKALKFLGSFFLPPELAAAPAWYLWFVEA